MGSKKLKTGADAWALGMVSAYTMGGFIHILLLLAVVSVAIQQINGRRVV